MDNIQGKEILIQGRPAGKGIAIGEVVLLDVPKKPVQPQSIKKSAVKRLVSKFEGAQKQLIAELNQLGEELEAGESSEIIDAQKQMIKDPEIEKGVYDIIETKLLNVDYAIYQTYDNFIERLKESGSELFRQRIIDLEDIRDRLITLVNDEDHQTSIKKGSVIVAEDISPTDIVSYYESGIAGIITSKGGLTSHAAIIAQSLGIACVVNAKNAVKAAEQSEIVIIDGGEGKILFNPAKKSLQEYKKRIKASKKEKKNASHDDISETRDGFPFHLLANIEFEAELPKIKECGGSGIGLLRTESLLFGKRHQKSEEEQAVFYDKIVKGTEGHVTIRLFDVGGDKTSYLSKREANPFLGWRGIRMLLSEKELMRNQLKAILKTAGKYPGRVKILVPMVSVIEEVKEIRKEIENIQGDLLSEGEKIDENIPLGIMVEVPSVAVSAYQFAKEADFLSLGTNDLTQYALAVDRGNEHISSLFQHYHPAVLRLISMTVEGAKKGDIDVCACGELAGDEIGAACLFGLGINELSMTPNSIGKIKDLLTSHTKAEFEALAAKAVEVATTKEVEHLFKNWKAL